MVQKGNSLSIAIFLSLLLLSSCVVDLPTSPNPNVDYEKIESLTRALSEDAKKSMEGIYHVSTGIATYGEELVGRWIGKRWCLYSTHDVVFSELAGGAIGDSILLRGYSRTVRNGTAVILDLYILPHEGGHELAAGLPPAQLLLRGMSANGEHLLLKRTRGIYTSGRPFQIIAHRGGGRNSERLGYSENSIEMMLHAQYYGATGIEIDIKRTRDNQLIVFHDDTFSPRTVKGAYLLGDVTNFDLNQIQLFGKLLYGEAIPTLSEALKEVIDKTELSTIWLDLKDPDIIDEAIRIQKDAIQYAASRRQNAIKIFLGIPSRDILDAYRSSSLRNTTPVVIELVVDDVLSALNPTCEVWAPRWTNGIQQADIERVHNSGKKVFVWTLDVRDYIEDFLYDSEIDGILTNYPSLVAGMQYSR